MKIITVNVNKGGAGKTTLAYNLAEYLRQDSRVLLLDFDDSANLTNRYGAFTDTTNTVIDLFDRSQVQPFNVATNLDLIPGHKEVELLKKRLVSRRREEYIFGAWLAKNEESLEETYDYIIIDTENDEGILTINTLVVSDTVIGISEASKDSFLALLSLRQFVNELNHEFDNQAQLLFVANKINFSENASKELLESLVKYNEYVGYLPQRSILKDDQSIFQQVGTKHKQVLEDAVTLFKSIETTVKEVR